MARDPPSTVSSSELRDLPLTPSYIQDAKVTIVHNQLRDLVYPLARGHLLYPKGNSVVEHKWTPEEDADSEEGDGPRRPKSITSGSIKPLVNLSFFPTCLTARGNIIACGGQHGELHLTTLPSSSCSTSSAPLSSRFVSSPPPASPFTLSLRLPTRSINNCITILPSWPEEWKQREKERKIGFVRPSASRIEEDADEDGSDEEMEVDSDLEDLEDLPSPSTSIATWPNTVPFVHPPRIPHLSPSQPPMEIPISASRRATSFGGQERSRPPHRASFGSTSLDRPGIQYISSVYPMPTFSASSQASSSGSSKRKRRDKVIHEPRILISNNDQTVKMYSLRETSFSQTDSQASDITAVIQENQQRRREAFQAARRVQEDERRIYDRFVNPPSAPAPRFGSSFGWDSIGTNEGLRAVSRDDEDETLRRELERAREHLRETEETLRREREEFERVIGMRVGSNRQSEETPLTGSILGQQQRRLSKVGGTRFKYAINHSSLSPDLKTMVSVGDSTDVYLFEVIDGGREFKKIGVYNAATDPAFSTSWSKDGRKFAVASQDGQVTVWDQRSSKPLAIFYTSFKPLSPSFSSDLVASQRTRSSSDIDERPNVRLIDPVSGEWSSGGSSSNRVPARVVKFSPEGSSRDLMVFSEENDNIHIVDAKTFNTHVVVPVPYEANGSDHARRTGVDNGYSGIAGVAFDPTGDWLYSATEGTVVEWDLRRTGGGGEGGTWGMA